MTAAAEHAASWESELASLLESLSTAQDGLLSLLAKKREHIVRGDHQSLAGLAAEEQRLSAELEACHQRRQQLLTEAESAGIACKSLHDVGAALPRAAASTARAAIESSRQKAELIRHECFAQWVAVQRSVLHLSQLLEIIATRGRGAPTYGNSESAGTSGALMDQAV
ncbi:MAG: flagellar export chaperone FlgN [Planctomycetales bacterium]|nr:flagellar export chaperone FlgN [Planctomycetales bacterium]